MSPLLAEKADCRETGKLEAADAHRARLPNDPVE
jgi:hypothetical protein